MNELEEFLKSHPGNSLSVMWVEPDRFWCSISQAMALNVDTIYTGKPSLQEAICDAIEQVKGGEK